MDTVESNIDAPRHAFRDRLSEADRQLIGRRFWISNPESLPNLLGRVPETDEVPDLEYRYDEKPPKGRQRSFIRCAHCFRTLHWQGNVAKYSNGMRILLGRNCGQDQFGFIWSEREESYDERASRHDLLVRLENLAEAMPLLRSFLEMLSGNRSLTLVEEAQQEFARKMPELLSTLGKVIEHSGASLQVTERIRDVAAELARDDRQKYSRNPETKPIFKTVTTSLGVIAGTSFVSNRTSLTATARKLIERCAALQDQTASLRSDNVGSGAALLDAAGALFEDTKYLLHRIGALNRFFDLGNLHRIAEWQRKRDLSRYSVSQQAISRLGEAATARIRRRTVEVLAWPSHRRIARLLQMSSREAIEL